MNCWKALGEKHSIGPQEAELTFKNVRTAYGRFLQRRKNVPSGLGRSDIPIPPEFGNLDWPSAFIEDRKTTDNLLGNQSTSLAVMNRNQAKITQARVSSIRIKKKLLKGCLMKSTMRTGTVMMLIMISLQKCQQVPMPQMLLNKMRVELYQMLKVPDQQQKIQPLISLC